NYYDGSGFNNAGQTFLLASGTTSYSYASASSKPSVGHTYHITVKTTDNTTTANSDNNAASRSFTYDTTPPTAAFTFPAAGGFYNASGWSGSITGPAADSGSGVNKVEVAIQDGSGNYYDGSGFNNAGQTFLLASGTTSWSYAIASSKLSDGHTYHITVKTTDNTTTANSDNNAASRSFTYDTTPPTAAFTFPAAGGFYNASGWSGSITGPAADSGSGVNKVEVAIQDGSGNYYDGSGFNNAGQTFLLASGTTSWSYAI